MARPRRPLSSSASTDSSGEIAEIVIDNPEARHALTLGMMEDLARAVLQLQAWSGSAVLLRASTPDAFCSGAHLGQVREVLLAPEQARAMAWIMSTVTDALLALPVVSVAVVEGPAVGGGAELSTATDHRVMHASAWIQFRQAALGVGAGWGGARRLVHHVPSGVALRWLTTSAKVDASMAAHAGYADLVVEDDVVAAARTLLRPVCALPPAGVRAVKTQLGLARAGGTREQDVDAFVAAWGGPAHRRALGLTQD